MTASSVMRSIVAPAAWLGQSWTLGKDQSLSREGEGAGNGCRAGGDCSLSGLVLGLSHSRVLLLAVPLLDLRQADFQVREIGARRGARRSPKAEPEGASHFHASGSPKSPKGPATFTQRAHAEGPTQKEPPASPWTWEPEGAQPLSRSFREPEEPEGASHFHAEGPRRGASHYSDWELDK